MSSAPTTPATDPAKAALIALHRGLERLGPGSDAVSRDILKALPRLPSPPRIADLGCGSGAASLMLAAHFQTPVLAVDFSAEFLGDLAHRAAARGLGALIRPVLADMGALDWPEASLDLLWSEGAAYNLGFAGALGTWRRLLAPLGVAVVSELSWHVPNPPEEAVAYWRAAYPEVSDEAGNRARAEAAGYRLLGLRRLPRQAWWDSYYDPLLARIAQLRPEASPELAEAIAETETEIDLFRRFGDSYGYTFYILGAD